MRRVAVVMGVALGIFALGTPIWLPLPGRLLVGTDPLVSADAVLVFEGAGVNAMDDAERLREQGLVTQVVIVEAPVRTHELTAYWRDFVRLGIARPSPTPAAFLHVVRAPTLQAGDQAQAAAPVLLALGERTVLLSGGGLDSRLNRREVAQVLGPLNITSRVVSLTPPEHDPDRWYTYAGDRRAVLEYWLQLAVPSLGRGSDAG